jgi:hypothetical protein
MMVSVLRRPALRRRSSSRDSQRVDNEARRGGLVHFLRRKKWGPLRLRWAGDIYNRPARWHDGRVARGPPSHQIETVQEAVVSDSTLRLPCPPRRPRRSPSPYPAPLLRGRYSNPELHRARVGQYREWRRKNQSCHQKSTPPYVSPPNAHSTACSIIIARPSSHATENASSPTPPTLLSLLGFFFW